MTTASIAAPAATRTIKVDVNTTSVFEKFDVLTFEVPASVSDEEFSTLIHEAAGDDGLLFFPEESIWENGMKCVAFDEGEYVNHGYEDHSSIDDISEVKAD